FRGLVLADSWVSSGVFRGTDGTLPRAFAWPQTRSCPWTCTGRNVSPSEGCRQRLQIKRAPRLERMRSARMSRVVFPWFGGETGETGAVAGRSRVLRHE